MEKYIEVGLFPHLGLRITDIDLTELLKQLDKTAFDISNHQRDALVSRKELAQKTKDFRKLDDASKLTEFKALLKGWA